MISSILFKIDNPKGCDEKPGKKTFSAPDDAGATIWNNMPAAPKDDPQALVFPCVIAYSYSNVNAGRY